MIRLEWLEKTDTQQLRVTGEYSLVLCELFRAGDWFGSFPTLPIMPRKMCDGDLAAVCARAEAVDTIRETLHALNEALVLTELKEVR